MNSRSYLEHPYKVKVIPRTFLVHLYLSLSLQGTPVLLASRVLEAPQDQSTLALRGPRAPPDPQASWDPQVSSIQSVKYIECH